MNTFPKDFVWGAAAAAYQIEGAAYVDGKGLSVWDMMCRQPGKVFEGHTGEVACDHYNRSTGDVGLMKEIGLKAYRLSISWPRVMPEGTGHVNEKGLAFYDRLVDQLLAAGIQPWATLFHWDFPYELYCRGGWLNRDSVEWFADYTAVIMDRLSDRVSHWMTLNEPQCYIILGHSWGIHAPGDTLGFAEVARAAHHTLMAHGRATQVIRARAKTAPQIGWAPVGGACIPHDASNSADVAAARQMMYQHRPLDLTKPRLDDTYFWANAIWSDPVILGRYPEEVQKDFEQHGVAIKDSDLATIAQPLDFFGVNIYQGSRVRANAEGKPEEVKKAVGYPSTAFKWVVSEDSLYWGPKFLYERYKMPVVITENGLASMDWPSLDGRVRDTQRIDFLERYLTSLQRATSDGVDVRGYFQWSIMDNFEWIEGYNHRFGLIHVDYQTQKRTLKDSAYWYGEVIKRNGVPPRA